MPVLVTFFDPEQLKDPAQMTSSMAVGLKPQQILSTIYHFTASCM